MNLNRKRRLEKKQKQKNLRKLKPESEFSESTKNYLATLLHGPEQVGNPLVYRVIEHGKQMIKNFTQPLEAKVNASSLADLKKL